MVRTTIERYFTPADRTPPVEVAASIFSKTLERFGLSVSGEQRDNLEEELRSHLHRLDDSTSFGSIRGDEPLPWYFQSLERQVLGSLDAGRTVTHVSGDGRIVSCGDLIRLAMKLSGKLAHELGHGDIRRAFNFGGDVIGNELSLLFTQYKLDQYLSAYAVIEESDKTFSQLIQEYRESEPPPWVTLREVLAEVRATSVDPELFNFEFSDPEGDKLTKANHGKYSFSPVFTNASTGESYSTASLSSGEKILLSLCFAAYNKAMGRRQPKLLLLDELDAVLHPSMISALIASLKAQFVNNGIPVIMATHSVTTASLVEEEAVFRLSRSESRLDVQKLTKSEVVADLSEGLATIEAGLTIAASESAAPITILSEGNNALHLKRWAELFFPGKVDVFDKMISATGKDQLASYARLLAKVTTNSHWLLVWDCDARATANRVRKELGDSPSVTVLAFSKRNNSLAKQGIENLYEEVYLMDFITTSRRESTGESTQSMSGKDKLDFSDHVAQEATKEYFKHFTELEEAVQDLLDNMESK
ncbi:MAG: AAA family ATPase [Gammaproteobacteria bacterium]|nr:AAA family ATPase [Gammaproteobacteria bacterium]